jgi:hypothetical protein
MDPALLIQSIKALSQSAEDQLMVLSALGCPGNVDEIALQFHDQAVIARQLMEAAQISPEQLLIVMEVDGLLDKISGKHNAALWTEDALNRSQDWDVIRCRAGAFFGT